MEIVRTPRRRLLEIAAFGWSAAVLPDPSLELRPKVGPETCDLIPLNGAWAFRIDQDRVGESQKWFAGEVTSGWRQVQVPHTWQIEPEFTEYMGVGWYRRVFDAPRRWSTEFVRIEFEAVFHTATVWINGQKVGEHIGKGYTAFTFDISPVLQFGKTNTVVVRADNSFNQNMLPRGTSSDWAHDGGIYRPVNLLITPAVFVEQVALEATPDLSAHTAEVQAKAVIRNTSAAAWTGQISFAARDRDSGLIVAGSAKTITQSLGPGERRSVQLPPATVQDPKLWHFDQPNLYEHSVDLSNGHSLRTRFGIRKIEVRGTKFYLNGEPVRLMGVERMAGSNPMYGMAEPTTWIDHDHRDLKELNCVYTRVHWPQDRRVLDWCDENGILIQTEVPTWGSATFEGMSEQPSTGIMNNGLQQLREMIARDRNHPCIFSWGVCNEIGGQNPPAYAFAKRMYEESKRLDPHRLVSYASHSLYKTPAKDVAGLMDYVMVNEYYESWHPGTTESLRRNLEEIHEAFPGKPVVISEYGYCACTPDRPEGDANRSEILRSHDSVFRELDYVAGLIFFCYNDYRTHMGDKGAGVCKQRIHGVVDVYGSRKGSWEVLRKQSSPVDSLDVSEKPPRLRVSVRTRPDAPAYVLRGYRVRGVAFGFGDIPLEQSVASLEDCVPGASVSTELTFSTPQPTKILIDILRPNGFSVATKVWSY